MVNIGSSRWWVSESLKTRKGRIGPTELGSFHLFSSPTSRAHRHLEAVGARLAGRQPARSMTTLTMPATTPSIVDAIVFPRGRLVPIPAPSTSRCRSST